MAAVIRQLSQKGFTSIAAFEKQVNNPTQSLQDIRRVRMNQTA
jgi:hypothetical protein